MNWPICYKRNTIGSTVIGLSVCLILTSIAMCEEATIDASGSSSYNDAGHLIPDRLLRGASESFQNSYQKINKAIAAQSFDGGKVDPLLVLSRAELALYLFDKDSAISDIRLALKLVESLPVSERGAVLRKCMNLTIKYHETPQLHFSFDSNKSSSRGLQAYKKGDTAKAALFYDAASKLDATDYQSCYFAAVCFHMLGKNDMAEQKLRMAIERESSYIRLLSGDLAISVERMRVNHSVTLEPIQGSSRHWLESSIIQIVMPSDDSE